MKPTRDRTLLACLHCPKVTLLVLSLMATVSPQASATEAPPTATGPQPNNATSTSGKEQGLGTGETVVMSPFEVDASAQRGYYSPNTMAGTRLNSKLEDLASSIAVVTKEQMADFALLNINDVFLYEASTEGTGTYTEFSFDRSGQAIDVTSLEPNTSNRMRGVSSANVAIGNFESSGRVPIDPINIDAVEISRGPNSNIFGLGKAGGTVNVLPASANLQRNRSELGLRWDSYDGYRTSLDLNRTLVKGKLAIRGSGAFQHEGFVRKPSGTDSLLLNGMVKYQPFKMTNLTASYSKYRIAGVRANQVMPRDAVTAWKNAGSPTYDNLTSRITINGVKGTTVYTPTTIPTYLSRAGGSGGANSNMAIYGDGAVGYWGPAHATPSNVLSAGINTLGFLNTAAPILTNQPLFAGDPSVTDKGIYDWTSINLGAPNYLNEKTETTTFGLEQFFINTPRHVLALQAGFYKENSDKYRRDLIGGATSQRAVGAVYVDPNEFFPDGRPNPNVGRTFVAAWIPNSYEEPLGRENYRAILAYKLDLRGEKNFLRWLGMHQLSAYGEYKEDTRRIIQYKDSVISNHPWVTTTAALGPGRAQPADNKVNTYFRFYVGDTKGANVDYAPGPIKWGSYTYTYGSATTGFRGTETATLGSAVTNAGGTNGGNNRRQILKTEGVVLQSHLFKDRVITTFGLRHDRNYNKTGVNQVFLPDGINIDMDAFNRWSTGDWRFNEGDTKTAGVVVKPTRWLNLHANVSNSFLPQVAAVNLQLAPVPDPSGKGKDYGFTLNLFSGKLVARFNQYDMNQINSRASQSATLATRLWMVDFEINNVALVPKATQWVARAHPTWTADQQNAEISRITGLDERYFRRVPDNLTEVADVTSKGREIEIFYNPTNYWTMKMNVTQTESIEAKVAPGITNWLAARLPVWQALIDPELGVPWLTTNIYDSSSALNRLTTQVTAPLAVAKAVEGKSRPQIRKYRVNLISSYGFEGLTDNRILKRLKVGGGLRWEDKGAIGYYGVQTFPDVITELDRNRPVYAPANLYVDAFVSYRMRLFSNKVGATFQLNVRNLQENGRLQAIAAYPNGTANGYRIIDPRQFILSATFDL
jgi:outer membrane receptor protein involved in Fe transport